MCSPYISVKAAADYIGISPKTVYEHIYRGALASHKVGARVLVDKHDLDDFMKRNRREAWAV